MYKNVFVGIVPIISNVMKGTYNDFLLEKVILFSSKWFNKSKVIFYVFKYLLGNTEVEF